MDAPARRGDTLGLRRAHPASAVGRDGSDAGARPLTGSAAASRAPGPRGVIRRRTGALYGPLRQRYSWHSGISGWSGLSGTKQSVPSAASIAVLPLANESGDASQQYFSDGISEDLITALSQFPGLKVIGRSSAFMFRDSKEDSHSIGAKLGVAHLLREA